VAEVINDIVSEKSNTFRNAVGLFADGFLNFTKSLRDEAWINSVSVSDEDWSNDGTNKVESKKIYAGRRVAKILNEKPQLIKII